MTTQEHIYHTWNLTGCLMWGVRKGGPPVSKFRHYKNQTKSCYRALFIPLYASVHFAVRLGMVCIFSV